MAIPFGTAFYLAIGVEKNLRAASAGPYITPSELICRAWSLRNAGDTEMHAHHYTSAIG